MTIKMIININSQSKSRGETQKSNPKENTYKWDFEK